MNNPPAFPQPMIRDVSGNINTSWENHPDFGGMTLRDWFAGITLQGWMASFGPEAKHPGESSLNDTGVDEIAKASYQLADAMLRQREKK